MAWSFSTGFKEAYLSRITTNDQYFLGSTASLPLTFADGEITAASGLDIFKAGDWIYATSPTNNNRRGKVATASAASLTFASGTWLAEAAAAKACIQTLRGGSILEIMENGTLYIYDGTEPADADTAVSGTLLAKITLDGGAFATGLSDNGLNLGTLTSSILKKATDPATGIKEVWSGDGLAASTATWGAWFANDVVTTASTTAVRLYGTVTSTSGGDIVMESGLDVAVGVPAVVSEMSIGAYSVAYT